MAQDNEKLEKLAAELNQLQQEMEMIKQQLEQLDMSLSEISSAQLTLEGIMKNDTKETMVPIGAGCFIITELKNTDEVVMGIGADIAIKQSTESTERTLKKQQNEIETVRNSLTQKLTEITKYLNEKRPEAEALMQQQQQ
ncbi:MAG: prefoldin subunit alpha [Methanobacteriaceae archaeon]|nr:prefoldin subunit alpha [Methanobacteriaceae archaeon]